MEDKVKLNGKEITKEELEEKKKEISEQKGVKLIESVPGKEFKTRIEG